MRIALTGGTGLVGHFLLAGALAAGDRVTLLSRRDPGLPGVAHVPYDLAGAVPDLSGQDVLIHAALAHEAGRYRGGEGDDAAGFVRRNRDGTLRLFDAALSGGLRRLVLLSSRAVLDGYPPGSRLPDGLPARPRTLYGQVKAEAEAAAAASGIGTSLRATGIYGPAPAGRAHKWHALFRDFAAGAEIAPRVGTEVHGGDLAAALRLILDQPAPLPVYNLSDIVLDRHDLLAAWARVSGATGRLPPRADPRTVSVLDCAALRGLGWRPRGMAGLEPALAEMRD